MARVGATFEVKNLALAVSLTFNTVAYRIDPSIRPEIHVDDLETADHLIFDITLSGIACQCIFAAWGYAWMYAMTRRTKLSLIAALPPFLLNILHVGTHTLCGALDVFVSAPLAILQAIR